MNEVIVILNERWRVVDDTLQWILEVRKGERRVKASGWVGRRFHCQRTALMRSIDELCGVVDPAALADLETLPGRHRSPGGDRG